jgi:ABC-type multidrug transport system fused ATPase/permease subunit
MKEANQRIHGRNIEFKNVWFAYDADQYVLKDISFRIRAGKTTCNCWPYRQW